MAESDLFSQIKPRVSVDTMLRTAQQNHVRLSAMADQKASIIMGAQAVILTILFSRLNSGYSTFWLWSMGITSLLSVVLSLMAIIPSYKKEKGWTPNWLFFSTFTKVAPEDYMKEISEIISTDENIYRTIINDIHQVGKVLQRKYRYLSFSYKTFLVGLIISCVILAIEKVC